MVSRFGSREICDVTFKAASNDQRVGNKNFKAGQPVFVIDTATASNMEQATTTVYAQGGKGNNRLMSWEGEKTMTFTVTDALLSPMSLAILTGAGFAEESAIKHVHVTYDVALSSTGTATITGQELANELGIALGTSTIYVCNDSQVKPYASILDSNGAIVDWADSVTFAGTSTEKPGTVEVTSSKPLSVTVKNGEAVVANKTVKLDFYVVMDTQATEIKIKPGDFGGYFYVEADTLYRNQDGKDMAATLTFPKVKIQSGFTIAMAATGDPSTFDFVMDAMPGYTYFDSTTKVVCDMTIVQGGASTETTTTHSSTVHTK